MQTCLTCKRIFKSSRNSLGKYCSNSCQMENQHNTYVESWLSGNEKGWSGKTKNLSHYVIRWIRTNYGTACQSCGWDKKHPIDGATLTEIDHIDGDAEHVSPENLRVLCPNCHSMTETFRARNKNSKRVRK